MYCHTRTYVGKHGLNKKDQNPKSEHDVPVMGALCTPWTCGHTDTSVRYTVHCTGFLSITSENTIIIS